MNKLMLSPLSSFYVSRQPQPVLSPYISSLWIWHGDPRPDGRDRMLPTGAPGLIVNLLEDETRIYNMDGSKVIHRLDGAGFDGAMTRPFVIDTAEQIYAAGVNFLPAGAWPFVSHAQDELLNTHLSLKDVWGADACSLREQMLLAASPAAALLVLETMLLSKLQRPMQRHAAVSHALTQIQLDPGRIRIEQCLQPGNVGSRRLTRLFEIETGMTPKRFARLLRFRQVIAHLQGNLPSHVVDWADVAVRFGYYDQAHLSHEFKDFSGFSPSAWLSLRGDFENHVAIC